MSDKPKFFTVQEIAEQMRCTPRTIYRYLEQGRFPNAKRRFFGWLIPEQDVQEFLERSPRE